MTKYEQKLSAGKIVRELMKQAGKRMIFTNLYYKKNSIDLDRCTRTIKCYQNTGNMSDEQLASNIARALGDSIKFEIRYTRGSQYSGRGGMIVAFPG